MDSNHRIFVSGIGTGIGKTVISALLVEALDADYWKPVQAGDLDSSDTKTVRSLVSREQVTFHPEVYRLKAAMSPHAAAAREGIRIEREKLILPPTPKPLIIEGAGGLMVPLNDELLIFDLIEYWQASVVVVVRHYLGSINHTLLTLKALKQSGLPVAGLIFNGEANAESTSFILQYSGIPLIGTIPLEQSVNPEMIRHYAKQLKPSIDRVFTTT